jgi:glutathione S-transferase
MVIWRSVKATLSLNTFSTRLTETVSMRPAAGTPERNDYIFWFHASPGSFQLVMSMDSLFRVLPTRVPWPLSIIMTMVASKVHDSFLDPRLEAILKLAEAQLANGDFLAGAFLTAADITSIYSFDAAFTRMTDLQQKYPNCQAWLERMRQRPAFVASMQKIGQDSISLPLL